MKGKSTIYRIILGVILTGYVFFFTSTFFFHEAKNYLYTEMNTKQALSEQVSLTLKKWTYSEKDHSMTVMFSAANSSLVPLNLNWSTYERHTTKLLNIETGSTQTKLKTDVKYPFENIVVVSVQEIPENFEEVSISLQLAKEMTENTDGVNKIVQFYSNINQVEKVDSIGNYTYTDYRIEYLNIQKADKLDKIKEYEDINKQLAEDNRTYEASISDLIANEEFETVEEIKSTKQKISAYRRQIDSNNTTISKNKYEIEDLHNAVKDIDDAIEKMREKE